MLLCSFELHLATFHGVDTHFVKESVADVLRVLPHAVSLQVLLYY